VLVDSPRLTPADRARWAELEHYDEALAADWKLGQLERLAVYQVCKFADGGECFAGVSWGKDSVVTAHLVELANQRHGYQVPLVWARADRYESPECEQVRDVFLKAHPDVRYEEHVYRWRVPLRGEPGWKADQPGQDALAETLDGLYGGRRITGLRAAESGARRMSAKVHGTASARSCRPVLNWPTRDVFAYLAREDLPVHPAYAMSAGGVWERDRLRVHALRTEVGDEAWERRYWPDVWVEESR
jgi:phosphoadenosine phosphosulfate reductase